MKRILLFMVLLSSIALAVNNCEDYLINAQSYPEETYPWYFGVGQEYMSAAECYELQGESVSQQYYADGATYFVGATTFLVEGGDYLLRGRAYERAADAYLKIGNTIGADQYYTNAMEQYELCDCKGEMAALTTKLNPAGSLSYPFILSMTGAAIVFIIAVFFMRRRRNSYYGSTWTTPDRSSKGDGKAPGSPGNGTGSRMGSQATHAKQSVQPPPRPTPPPVVDAKEKMRRRIREKYKLE